MRFRTILYEGAMLIIGIVFTLAIFSFLLVAMENTDNFYWIQAALIGGAIFVLAFLLCFFVSTGRQFFSWMHIDEKGLLYTGLFCDDIFLSWQDCNGIGIKLFLMRATTNKWLYTSRLA